MDAQEASGPSTGLTAGRLKVIALRQWWVVVLCGFVAAAGAAAYAEERPVHYIAKTTVNTGALPTSSSQSGPSVSLPDPLSEIGNSKVWKAAESAAGTSDVVVTGALSTDGTQVVLEVTAPSAAEAQHGAVAATRALVKLRAHDIDAQASALSPQLGTLGAKITYLDHQAGSTLRGTSGTSSSNSLPTALSTELSVLTGQYSAVYGQQVQLQLVAQSLHADQNGPPPVSPTGGGKKKLVSIALGVGLIAGCGLGLLRDLSRDRLTSVSELPELSRLPLLAEVPNHHLPRKRTLIDTFDGRFAEAVRELRTSVSLSPRGQPSRVLLVASAAADEGKSLVAASLAVACALSGARTVIVSSDLRHPSVDRLLGAEKTRGGLAALLRHPPSDEVLVEAAADDTKPSAAGLESYLQATSLQGLRVLPAGPYPPNPSELLVSAAMARLVSWLRTQADIVVLDSPPVLAVTDAVILSGYADAVLLVISSGRSSKASVRRTLDVLERAPAPLAGYVLNRATRPSLASYRYVSTNGKLNGSAAHAPVAPRRT
jgi:capsular exopolysaccharide synthesis family protein